MKIFPLAACLIIALLSCKHSEPVPKEKQYPFSGRIVSVSLADQTATIDAEAIPTYMDAMTMDYPIKSKDELQKLQPGDLISATVNVGESGSYSVSGIRVTGHAAPMKK